MNGKLISKEYGGAMAAYFENKRLFSNEVPQVETIEARLIAELATRRGVKNIELVKGWNEQDKREMMIIAGTDEYGEIVGDTVLSLGVPFPKRNNAKV